jgi:diaminopimelate decarboxylase
VNTVKPTPETTTVVGIDAGMTTLARPALYDAYHAVRSLEPDRPEKKPTRVELAGPVCETADVLGRDRRLPAPTQGDLLAVGNAGAYGYEMASNYNSRPRPAVVAVADGDAWLATRRETLADVTRLEP